MYIVYKFKGLRNLGRIQNSHFWEARPYAGSNSRAAGSTPQNSALQSVNAAMTCSRAGVHLAHRHLPPVRSQRPSAPAFQWL